MKMRVKRIRVNQGLGVYNSINMKYKTRPCYFNLLKTKKMFKKRDFWKTFDPFFFFLLNTVPRTHDPRISGLSFGTKNHKMRGPPIIVFHVTKLINRIGLNLV